MTSISYQYHGANADCPDVQNGRWPRCLGHPSVLPKAEETTAEDIRNALQLLGQIPDHPLTREELVDAVRAVLPRTKALLHRALTREEGR